MALSRGVCSLFLACACAGWASAQDAPPAPTPDSRLPVASADDNKAAPAASEIVPLIVPQGMGVQIALDQEVRIRKVGQPISGHVVEPVYAFDQLVVPVGTTVTGQITRIEGISNGKRILSALDAEFTPAHKIEVEFTGFVFPDGKHLPIHTRVTPGSGQVIQFVTAADADKQKGVKDAAAEKAKEAKAEAKREWDSAMQQVKEPGKVRKIERYVVAQLPVHPQYIDAGTVYLAELQQPLDFGSEPLTPQLAASLISLPPDGSFVRARLMTPLSSATSQIDDQVEAMLTRPLFDGDRLILPQGAVLRGSVVQVEPARHMSRNGQLRFVFHDLVLPNGLDQKVSTVLAGVQAGKTDNLSSIRKVVHEPLPPNRATFKLESLLDWPQSRLLGMATQTYLISQLAGPTVSSSWVSQWELRRVRIPSASPWAHLAQAAPCTSTSSRAAATSCSPKIPRCRSASAFDQCLQHWSCRNSDRRR